MVFIDVNLKKLQFHFPLFLKKKKKLAKNETEEKQSAKFRIKNLDWQKKKVNRTKHFDKKENNNRNRQTR